jgi:hypothetical protein
VVLGKRKSERGGRIRAGHAEKPHVWFWLTVASAARALPVAVLVACQVRGEYVHTAQERQAVYAAIHGPVSILVRAVIGATVAVILAVTAIRLRHR